MRRSRGWSSGLFGPARLRAMPDPTLVRRAEEITDLRERRLAYEEAAQNSPRVTRGPRRVAVLAVACAAAVTFALTVLAAVAGNPWVAAAAAALVAALLTAVATQRPATRSFDHVLRPRRQLRDVREPLDD